MTGSERYVERPKYMKNYLFSVVSMISLLTLAQPILALEGTSSVKADETTPERLRDFNPRLNPQVGLSNFEHSKESGSHKSTAFGLTAELGQTEMRKLETGFLVLQTGSDAVTSTYLTIPM